MKSVFRHISLLAAAIALMATSFLSACDTSHEPTQTPPNKSPETFDDINISFTISAGDMPTRSIAEAFGTVFENRVDTDDFRVLLFDEEGTLFDIFYLDGSTSDHATLEPLGYGSWILRAHLDPMRYNSSSRFAVIALANWSQHSKNVVLDFTIGRTTVDDLRSAIFGLNPEGTAAWQCDANHSIPMFGSRFASLEGYSTTLYSESNPMDIGDIDLVRAFAKIEVVDESPAQSAKIESIELTRRYTEGRMMQDFLFTGATGQVSAPTIPVPAGYTEQPLKLAQSGKTYSVYVPEFELSTLEQRKALKVNLDINGFKETRWIYLAPYGADGGPLLTTPLADEWKALLRNHIYRFSIRTLNADPEMDVVVDVQPYAEVILRPDFGLERTEDGYIVVRDKKGNVVKYIRTDGSVLTLHSVTDWPDLGEFMGVFDSQKQMLIGYFPDGRAIFMNYADESQTDFLGWEIYSAESDDSDPMFILEEFLVKGYGSGTNQTISPFTHNIYDNRGRIVEQYIYKDLASFTARKSTGDGALRRSIGYTGNRYGTKTISYYNEANAVYATIVVTVNADGTETETYK